MDETITYLYRGVHAKHPFLADAAQGIVRPGNVNGTVSARMHNEGGFSAESPFTSWTHDRFVAIFHARRHGPGGILLRVPCGPAEAEDEWSWERSDDAYFEDEVLLRGVRIHIEVEQL